ncbi:MAG TPA: thiolase domain-containing protein, partial [Bellilinea sp.]|nr:thiolase domain-containing protein [Bellilinea sp.]
MREVSVIGIGQTPIKENWELSLKELAGQASLSAMENAKVQTVDGVFVGNMMSGSANKQQHLG